VVFINCNYDVNDYTISSQFYQDLDVSRTIVVVVQFRGTFASECNWQRIIWNNKEIRIDKKGSVHLMSLSFELTDRVTSFSQR